MTRSQTWAFGGGLVFLLQCFWFRRFAIDDAFITYRYAQHWASGWGPVMNAGERVEGVSNLPWAALLALGQRFGLEPHGIAPWLSVVCGILCVWWTTRLATRWQSPATPQPPQVASVALVLACLAPLAIWSVSGMETLAYTASVVVVGLWWATHPTTARLRFGMLLGLVACMRPEGGLLILAWLVSAWWGPTRRLVPLGWQRTLVGIVVLVLPVWGLRLWFYGDGVANTVQAKVSFQAALWMPGLVYAGKAILATAPLWLLAGLRWRRAGFTDVQRMALAWIVLQVGFMVVVGGERFPGYRFLVPLLPFLALFAVHGDPRPGWRPTRAAAAALTVLLLVGVSCMVQPQWALTLFEPIASMLRLQQDVSMHTSRLLQEARFVGFMLVGVAAVWALRGRRTPRLLMLVALLWGAGRLDVSQSACREAGPAATYGRTVGLWLRDAAPVDTRVATNGAGALPYFSRLPVIDMLGLTDAHIARSRPDVQQWIGHERGDGAYVLGRRPDIIVFGGPEGSATPWSFPGDQQIAAAPAFRERYELQRVTLSGFDFLYYRARDGRMPRVAEPARNDDTP